MKICLRNDISSFSWTTHLPMSRAPTSPTWRSRFFPPIRHQIFNLWTRGSLQRLRPSTGSICSDLSCPRWIPGCHTPVQIGDATGRYPFGCDSMAGRKDKHDPALFWGSRVPVYTHRSANMRQWRWRQRPHCSARPTQFRFRLEDLVSRVSRWWIRDWGYSRELGGRFGCLF